jgi:hypothetical protein
MMASPCRLPHIGVLSDVLQNGARREKFRGARSNGRVINPS